MTLAHQVIDIACIIGSVIICQIPHFTGGEIVSQKGEIVQGYSVCEKHQDKNLHLLIVKTSF